MRFVDDDDFEFFKKFWLTRVPLTRPNDYTAPDKSLSPSLAQ